jgi:phage antirepressor YoqD-like protein
MRDVAGVLNINGWGRNKIFEYLRKQDVLDDRNVPYREFQDRGYFRVIEQKWTDGEGETHISLKTLVYQKGVDYIRRLNISLPKPLFDGIFVKSSLLTFANDRDRCNTAAPPL